MTHRILIICNSFLHKDPRVLRQVLALKNDYEIETVGFSNIKGCKNYLIAHNTSIVFKIVKYFLLLLRMYPMVAKLQFIFKEEKPNGKDYSFIICNDIDSMPLGKELGKSKAPIWLDLHEYSPSEFETNRIWKLLYAPFKTWCCKKYLQQSNLITNVCDGIAEKYKNEFGAETNEIITNAPEYKSDLIPSNTSNRKIGIVHHGGAMRNRGLHQMIELMNYLDDSYELNMMLVANNQQHKIYLQELKDLARNLGVNVNFLDPVPSRQIAEAINRFDIGLYYLLPITLNEEYSLPNKFFEFIQARLAIAITPNVEMKKIVEKYDLGIVSEGFSLDEMAKSIKSIDVERIEYFKNQNNKYAKDLSFEANRVKMLDLANSLSSQKK